MPEIRKCSLRDVPALVALNQHVQSRYSENFFRKFIEGERKQCFIAEQDGKPVGYVVEGHKCGFPTTQSAAVLPEYRRQGIASALMAQAIEGIKRRNPAYERFVGRSRASNVASQKLHESLGMRVRERIPNYYEDGEEVIVYEKEI